MSTLATASPKDGMGAGTLQCGVCRSGNLLGAFRVGQREYVRCRDCGLTFRKGIDPQAERSKYEDGAYHRMEHQHRLDLKEAVFARSLREIGRRTKPGRLLDVGCGNGSFLHLARLRGWETYGVELSPTDCAYARATFGVNVVQGSLPEAGFADRLFDVVTLHDVLCHLPAPLEQLREVHRILTPGGLLVLRVRNALFHAGLIRLSQALEPYLVFHLYCFTPQTIRALLGRAGFTRISVRNAVPTPADPYLVSPLWGDRGMGAIKRSVYWATEVLAYCSGHALTLGPSLQIHARKGSEDDQAVRGVGASGTETAPANRRRATP